MKVDINPVVVALATTMSPAELLLLLFAILLLKQFPKELPPKSVEETGVAPGKTKDLKRSKRTAKTSSEKPKSKGERARKSERPTRS